MTTPTKEFSEFFKVYLPEYSRKHMHIPSAFLERFNGFVPEKAILRDYVGRVWHLKVGRVGNEVYFLDGWQQFRRENFIKEADFLVFQYDGRYTFDFKLFENTGCEKKNAGVNLDVNRRNFCVKNEDATEMEREEDDNDDYYNGDEVVEDKGEGKEENSEEKEDDEEEEEEEEETTEKNEKELPKSSNDKVIGRKRRGRPPSGRKKYDGQKQTSVKKSEGVNDENGCSKSKCSKVSSAQVEEEMGLDIEKIVKLPNPYFITKIRPGRRSRLFVPADVIKDHNIILPPSMILRDPYSRSWSVDVSVWKDGRIWLSKWRPFCKWNRVGEDDLLICEFVEENGRRGDVIVVHIHRVQPKLVEPKCNTKVKVDKK